MGSRGLGGVGCRGRRRFGELEGFVGGVGEEVGAGDVAGELVEVEGAAGPGEDLDVDFAGGGGGAPVPGGDEFGFAVFVFLGGAEGAGFGAEEGGRVS